MSDSPLPSFRRMKTGPTEMGFSSRDGFRRGYYDQPASRGGSAGDAGGQKFNTLYIKVFDSTTNSITTLPVATG